MLKERQHLTVGNRYISRRFIGNRKVFENYTDKTEILSGEEIFTDKADDAVVHVEVDGKSYQDTGSNLLYLKTFVQNMALTNTSGVPTSSSNSINQASMSGKIYTNTNTHLTLSLNDGEYDYHTIAFYDVEDKYIKSEQKHGGSASVSYTIPSNADYFIASASRQGLTRAQIEWGSSSSEYTTKPPAPSPDYPIEIHSLNDFDVVSSVGRRNLLKNSQIEATSARYDIVSYTPSESLIEGEEYTLSICVSPAQGVISLRPYLSSGYSSQINIPLSGTNKQVDTVTFIASYMSGRTPEENPNHSNLVFYRFPNDGTVTGATTIHWVKVIKGRQNSLNYTPAPEDIPYDTLQDGLYKTNLLLDEPLRSVGDVKDRLFRDSDGLWKVERNVGEYIFDGTENFILETRMPELNIAQMYSFQNSFKVSRSNDSKGLSSHFSITDNSGALSASPNIGEKMNLHNKYGAMRFRVNTLLRFGKSVTEVTSEDLKNWLKDNPVTVLFEYNNSIIEILSPSLQDKLNNIASFADSNYVYTIVDKSDILSEKLKPTLHATFKSEGWYEAFKIGEVK